MYKKIIILLSSEEQKIAMKWLETSRTPVELVYANWKKCFHIRQEFFQGNSTTKKKLLTWPVLGTPMCPHLVNVKVTFKCAVY